MNKKVYPLEQLYIGTFHGKRKVVYLDEKYGYFDLSCRLTASQYNENFNNEIKIISSLDEVLKKNNLESLTIDKDGNYKQFFNLDELNYILKILERKLLLSPSTIQRIHYASFHLTQIISDLLGLNINVMPNTKYNFLGNLDIDEVLVPAKKLNLFKEYLISYIESSLISDDSVVFTYEVGSRDYRISRALNRAKISQKGRIKQNIFSVKLDEKGKIAINDIDIQKYKFNYGFQKTIKS